MQSFSRTERFLSLFTYLRSGEGPAALLLCAQSFMLMFCYYSLKVIREPMILADGSAELRAYSNAAQALLLMFIVPLFAKFYQLTAGRPGKHHLFHNTLLFFLANLLLFAFAYRAGWPIGILFYIWLGIFSVMILALFWAFATDLFNIKSGQRMFPLIAAASAMGALLGSGAAGDLDRLLGHDGVMLCAAGLLLLPLWLCRRVERAVPGESGTLPEETSANAPYHLLEGFDIVRRSRYLSLLALFVILINLINTNGEYILSTLVKSASLAGAASGADSEAFIAQFYSRYLFMTTLIGFLIQLLLVSRILKHWGIGTALYVLPLLLIANYSLLALFPMLAVARATMIAENSVNYSLQTTLRHALFLPVGREEKYVGKHTIDTFCFRLGDVVSGALVFAGTKILGVGLLAFVLVNLLLSGALLLISGLVSRHHRGAARENLENLPPLVTAQLEDLFLTAGEPSELELDPDTFIDPDRGDALRYQAFAGHSGRLPGWIRFDNLNRRFQFRPPLDAQGSLVIRVVARDFQGLEAEVSFTLNYGR